jgi:hypothetical protein
MKTSEVYNDKLHRGKPRGYYDPQPIEMFFTKVGQAIFKFTDDHQHKTQMTDEDWITHCKAADKCVRFGTLYGPKSTSDFTSEELVIVKKFVSKKKQWI